MSELGQVVERLVDARCEATPPAVRSWYPAAEYRLLARAEIADDLSHIDDAEYGRSYAAWAALPGVSDPAAFQNRVVRTHDGGLALSGIRFRGQAIDQPFVDVCVLEGDLEAGRLARVGRQLRDEWAEFEPRRIRFRVPSVEALASGSETGSPAADQVVMAAPLDQIRGRGSDRKGLMVSRASDLAFYPQYEEELELLFRRTPRAAETTSIETRESLETARSAGLLFTVQAHGRWAGVLAVAKAQRHGLRGYNVKEFMLAQWSRGRDWAATAQQLMVEDLPNVPGDLLFGTIDARNTSALTAARAAGRSDVGGWVWISV